MTQGAGVLGEPRGEDQGVSRPTRPDRWPRRHQAPRLGVGHEGRALCALSVPRRDAETSCLSVCPAGEGSVRVWGAPAPPSGQPRAGLRPAGREQQTWDRPRACE